MNTHTFINLEQFAYAKDPPKDNHTHFPSLGDWPQDVFLQILENCPPLTLVASRQVCKAIKQALDDNPSVWIESRAKISWPPPPPSALEQGDFPSTEWSWASHVAKRVFAGKNHSLDKKYPEVAWTTQYRDQYIIHKDYNLERVRINLQKRLPDHPGKAAITRTIANYLRTPSCVALLRAFNHSLEVIPDMVWNSALPAMHCELGLISSCDPAKIPPNYRCDDYDRILCPACHPRPLATRWRVTQLKTTAAKYRWFAENTVRVHEIYKHYETNHPDLLHDDGPSVVPALNCYTRCAICPRLAGMKMHSRAPLKMHTLRGMQNHYKEHHSEAYYEPDDFWFSHAERSYYPPV